MAGGEGSPCISLQCDFIRWKEALWQNRSRGEQLNGGMDEKEKNTVH